MALVSAADLLGYAAGLMTLIAFAQTEVRRMRLAAIAANVLFILFALAVAAFPVLALHALLLPLNLYRLLGLCRRPTPPHIAGSHRFGLVGAGLGPARNGRR